MNSVILKISISLEVKNHVYVQGETMKMKGLRQVGIQNLVCIVKARKQDLPGQRIEMELSWHVCAPAFLGIPFYFNFSKM